MRNAEIISKLESFKFRIESDVLPAYQNRGHNFGAERFSAWKRQIIKFLNEYIPGESSKLESKLTHFVMSRGMRESDAHVFWRMYGEPSISFIDSLIIDIQNGEFPDRDTMKNGKNSVVVQEKRMKGREMEEDNEEIFKVFISHGRSPLWHDISRYIEKQLDIDTIELEEQLNQGKTIIEKLEDAASECHFAIVIMTAEDEQVSGSFRTRQNVIHEIGYLQGLLGRKNVLVLKENGVEEFSNISGIVYEPFSQNTVRTSYDRIRRELEHAVDEWQNEDDEEE